MPEPFVPFLDLNLMKAVLLDAFGIAVISYVISLSIARIVAAKFKYQVMPERPWWNRLGIGLWCSCRILVEVMSHPLLTFSSFISVLNFCVCLRLTWECRSGSVHWKINSERRKKPSGLFSSKRKYSPQILV